MRSAIYTIRRWHRRNVSQIDRALVAIRRAEREFAARRGMESFV